MGNYMAKVMKKHKKMMEEHGEEEMMPKEKYEISEEKETYKMPKKEGKLPVASGTIEMAKSPKMQSEDLVLLSAKLAASKKKKKA